MSASSAICIINSLKNESSNFKNAKPVIENMKSQWNFLIACKYECVSLRTQSFLSFCSFAFLELESFCKSNDSKKEQTSYAIAGKKMPLNLFHLWTLCTQAFQLPTVLGYLRLQYRWCTKDICYILQVNFLSLYQGCIINNINNHKSRLLKYNFQLHS